MKEPFFKKIVWAVDALEPYDFQINAHFILNLLTRETSSEVYPVHIRNYLLPKSEESLSTYEEAYLALAEKRLKELKDNSAISRMRDGEILVNPEGKVRVAVKMLIDFANEKDADVIAVSTHSRKGLNRFLIGSFAETLLLQSNIPLITVNPETKVRDKISKILLPTTFDVKLRPAFQKTLELCSSLGASLTLFYKEPFFPMLEMSRELLQLLVHESELRQKEGSHLIGIAKELNVPLEIKMDAEPGNVADEIIAFAATNSFDLIAMAFQTSQGESPRVGSICRNVVRNAECPVWSFKTDDR